MSTKEQTQKFVGRIPWTVVTANTQMEANRAYIVNSGSVITLTLPASLAAGDLIMISGLGAGGWKIAQNAGQTIHRNGSSTTTGMGAGIQSTSRYDSITLNTIAADTLSTLSFVGTINTYVSSDPRYLANQINGKPVVRFTGSQLLKIADNLALFGAHVSFFGVFRIKTSGGSTWWLQRNSSPGETGSWLFGNTLGDNKMSFYSTSDDTHTKSSFVPSNLTAFQQTTIYDGSTVANRHNGSADTTSPDSGGGDLVDNGGYITIGGMNNYGGDSGFQVDIGDLLFFTDSVSNGDRDSIEGYLLNKYGLGSGSVFDPTTVANLQVWLKADALSLSDGGLVSLWPDSSGNDNDAVSA